MMIKKGCDVKISFTVSILDPTETKSCTNPEEKR